MKFERIVFDEVGSTNDEAMRLARDGVAEGLVVTARRQTLGRGRQGRVWQSPEGNLYASFLLKPCVPVDHLGHLSLVAALAVGETVGRCGVPFALKWPNDVLVQGAKIAGILLEREADWIVVGIGLNVAHRPPVTDREVTTLREEAEVLWQSSQIAGESSFDIAVDSVLGLLEEELSRWYGVWLEQGIAAIRDAWLARAYGLGDHIKVVVSDGNVIEGTFLDMDHQGAIVVKTNNETITHCISGDVFFL